MNSPKRKCNKSYKGYKNETNEGTEEKNKDFHIAQISLEELKLSREGKTVDQSTSKIPTDLEIKPKEQVVSPEKLKLSREIKTVDQSASKIPTDLEIKPEEPKEQVTKNAVKKESPQEEVGTNTGREEGGEPTNEIDVNRFSEMGLGNDSENDAGVEKLLEPSDSRDVKDLKQDQAEKKKKVILLGLNRPPTPMPRKTNEGNLNSGSFALLQKEISKDKFVFVLCPTPRKSDSGNVRDSKQIQKEMKGKKLVFEDLNTSPFVGLHVPLPRKLSLPLKDPFSDEDSTWDYATALFSKKESIMQVGSSTNLKRGDDTMHEGEQSSKIAKDPKQDLDEAKFETVFGDSAEHSALLAPGSELKAKNPLFKEVGTIYRGDGPALVYTTAGPFQRVNSGRFSCTKTTDAANLEGGTGSSSFDCHSSLREEIKNLKRDILEIQPSVNELRKFWEIEVICRATEEVDPIITVSPDKPVTVRIGGHVLRILCEQDNNEIDSSPTGAIPKASKISQKKPSKSQRSRQENNKEEKRSGARKRT